MKSHVSILDYQTPAVPLANRGLRRFQTVYAIGILLSYTIIGFCVILWPDNSNSADLLKAVLAMAMQVVGGAACVWLALALWHIVRNPTLRRSVLIWLLVLTNIIIALEVVGESYQ